MSKKNTPIRLFFIVVFCMAIVVALAALGLIRPYVQTVLMSMGINIIFAASLNIVNGYMGEFSCGHAGFMAVGAYTSSVLSLMLFNENKFTGSPLFPPSSAVVLFPLVIIIGGICAGLISLLVAIPSFKTRDDYLAIITIASNYIITTSINNISAVEGSRGLMGMRGTVLAMEQTAKLPWMLIWVMVFVLFCLIAIKRLMGSVLGKGIPAIRYDEISAEIMSVNTNRMKLLAFMFSSALAGVAGGLFAHVYGFINPRTFDIMKSTEGMVMVYLGGMGSLSGSALAAVLFTFLLQLLTPLLILKWVFIPLLLILLMQFRPEGLMGNRELPELAAELLEKFRERRQQARGRNRPDGGSSGVSSGRGGADNGAED